VRGKERVTVLTTIGWHRRSRDAIAERYGATTSRARASLPLGVEAIPIRGAGETMFWLPGHRALVPGDRILGGERGDLRLCPDSWLRYLPSKITQAQLAELLRPLLDLPIELVLVSHGNPVLRRGRAALERALRQAPRAA
jgi:glyoxylase-like metal-dependent hydrolase (beta-lactamase superfamily II)